MERASYITVGGWGKSSFPLRKRGGGGGGSFRHAEGMLGEGHEKFWGSLYMVPSHFTAGGQKM